MIPAWSGILINGFFMWLSLWVAFAKVNRPISWGAFYFNLAAAGINLVAVLMHFYRLAST